MWYPNIPIIPVNKNTGISSFLGLYNFFSLNLINRNNKNVAITNLKKVNVNGGMYGVDSFPATNAPDQKNVAKIIKR